MVSEGAAEQARRRDSAVRLIVRHQPGSTQVAGPSCPQPPSPQPPVVDAKQATQAVEHAGRIVLPLVGGGVGACRQGAGQAGSGGGDRRARQASEWSKWARQAAGGDRRVRKGRMGVQEEAQLAGRQAARTWREVLRGLLEKVGLLQLPLRRSLRRGRPGQRGCGQHISHRPACRARQSSAPNPCSRPWQRAPGPPPARC